MNSNSNSIHWICLILSGRSARRRWQACIAGILLGLALGLLWLWLTPLPAHADLGTDIIWVGTEQMTTTSVAWGDWDGDGDLDLAVGNGGWLYPTAGEVNQVYENEGGSFSLAWESTGDARVTRSVAWGDWDGDGDLDLAVGNSDVTQVYENDGETLQLDPDNDFGWESVEGSRSVAWGDWDGDGDLDLAAGGSTRVYENDEGTLKLDPDNSFGWEEPGIGSYDVVWGDWDRDGDLDLVTANEWHGSRVYENDGDSLKCDPAGGFGWISPGSPYAEKTLGVAWGDWDGDGDLDLAVANAGQYDRQFFGDYNHVYENDGGTLKLDPDNGLGWTSTDDSSWSTSVAWGDWDGDGDLDLAVGNQPTRLLGGENQVYENHAGTLNLDPDNGFGWRETGSPLDTWSIAWGDVDGDGDLDLAAGNHHEHDTFTLAQANCVYQNDEEGNLNLAWEPTGHLSDTTSLAWGDWDGDGDLDLAVGNGCWGYSSICEPNQVYENDSGNLSLAWESTHHLSDTTSLAWGDWDKDGDLDLAVGNLSAVNQVYENEGGSFSLAWESTGDKSRTRSLAWGDWDGDGDLDLAVGNEYSQPNQIYESDGGTLKFDPGNGFGWQSTGDEGSTRSVAWGDWDGDGDLDLAVGNLSAVNQVYQNDNGSLNLAWESTDDTLYEKWTRSVAWGDWDGDGDQDLAVGNDSAVNKVYESKGGSLSLAWQSTGDERHTASVAWGDWDGDGDLDLAVGNDEAVDQVYQNDGGNLSLAWQSTGYERPTTGLAWGDWDGDGDLDLAVGNGCAHHPTMCYPNQVYRNPRLGGARPANNPPRATVHRPHATHDAFFYSMSRQTETVTISIPYILSDPELDRVSRVQGYYSFNGGGQWFSALPSTDTVTTNLTTGYLTHTTTGVAIPGSGSASSSLILSGTGQIHHLELALTISHTQNSQLAASLWAPWPTPAGTSVLLFDSVPSSGDGFENLVLRDRATRSILLNDSDCSAYTTYVSSDVPKVISSSVYATITSTLFVGDSSTIVDVNVLNLSGDYTFLYYDSLDFYLQSPTGTRVHIMDLSCQSGNGFNLNLNDDTSLGSWPCPPTNGDVYRPTNALSAFDGENTNGTWSLVIDKHGVSNGSLESWSLAICSSRDTKISNAYRPVEPLSRFRGAPINTPFTLTIMNSAIGEMGTLEWWTLKSIGAEHTYTWDTFASGFFGQSDNVILRLDVTGLTGPFQHDKTTAYSPPFRVQGTRVQVVSKTVTGSVPISNAIVYHLPKDEPDSGLPLADSGGTPFRTDHRGYLLGHGKIGLGDHLFAMAPVHTQLNYEGALVFDGEDDYVIANPLANAPITATTVSFWISSTQTTSGAPFSYASPATDSTFLITDPDGFVIYRGNGVSVTTPVTVTDGAWHHIVVTWRSFDGQIKLYKDGIAAYTNTLALGTVISPGGSLVLGKDQNGNGFFAGSLDEVRIWRNIVLTQTQILDDMFGLLGENEPGLVVYWPFDDPENPAHDQSPNANDATIYGATWLGDYLGGYTVYHTSAAPTEIGLDAFTITEPGVQVLTVTAEHPLVLFDIVVSLEWDAHNDPSYLQQLEFDLHRASEHLYDFTNGQVALGHVTVYQNADEWAFSNAVVHATNRMRPFAAQGGIVLTPTVDLEPEHDDIIYGPGQVHMGATWNRYGTPGQNLGEDWPLVLAHELSHYLLYQDDVYLGLNEDDLLIPVDTCTGSAMGDVYEPANTEFVFSHTHWINNCADTLPARTLERTEWETIQLWYPWLITPAVLNPGPSLMPFDLTTIEILEPITPTNALVAPTFYLDYQDHKVSSSEARAFLLRNGDGHESNYEYVIDLGNSTAGQNQVLARGAQPGDRLCVFDRQLHQYGCEEIISGDNHLGLEEEETWTPLIQLSPVNSTTFTIQLSNLPILTHTLHARIYHEYGPGAAAITLTQGSKGYSGTLSLPYPVMAGHIQVWVDETATETNPRRETIVAYSVGGNPGFVRHSGGFVRHSGGFVRHSGGFVRHSGAPLVSSDGQMIFFTVNPATFQEGEFYAVQDMASLPLLPEGKVAIGQGYNLAPSPNVTRVITGSISFQYLQSDVLAEGINEANEERELTIYFWDHLGWHTLDTICDSKYNLASAPGQGNGVYALLAGITEPSITWIEPVTLTNSYTESVEILGNGFLQPLDVIMYGAAATYTLPHQWISPTLITAVVTQGLPADEYQVMVINRSQSGGPVASPTPGILALYDPAPTGACFYDFFQSGASRWDLGGDWDIVTLPSGERALTDSPAGAYSSAVPPAITHTTAVTSAAFNLDACTQPVLAFRHDYVIATGAAHQDVGQVEISADGGATWTKLASYSGGGIWGMRAQNVESQEWTEISWKDVQIDLSGYTGIVRLRFALKVDQYGTDKGWVMDDVVVKSAGSNVYLPLILRNY